MPKIRSVSAKLDQWMCLARGKLLAIRIRMWGGYAGPKIMAEKGVHLRHQPGRGWNIQGNVYFGRGVILDVWPGAELQIDAGTKIMHYVVIGVRNRVSIGCDCQVAEMSTIRDADHGIDTSGLISQSNMMASPITIGRNTWIARGCAVLAGAMLGEGVVVAANSVVRSHYPDDVLIAGAPAQIKRLRLGSSPIS